MRKMPPLAHARINFLCGDVDTQFLAFLKAKEKAAFVSAAAAPAHKPSAEPAGETVLTIDDCILEEICVNSVDHHDMSAHRHPKAPFGGQAVGGEGIDHHERTIPNIFESVQKEVGGRQIDADDFDVSLLTIDDDIFEYHERNVQRKKCARKSESRRSQPKLRERVASGCRGRQVRPGTCHRTRW